MKVEQYPRTTVKVMSTISTSVVWQGATSGWFLIPYVDGVAVNAYISETWSKLTS